ncbi:hypothetical protein ACH50O_03670 [Methylomonas sp. 2BW1-5-20]
MPQINFGGPAMDLAGDTTPATLFMLLCIDISSSVDWLADAAKD